MPCGGSTKEEWENCLDCYSLSLIVHVLILGQGFSESCKMSKAWYSVGNKRSPGSIYCDIPERESCGLGEPLYMSQESMWHSSEESCKKRGSKDGVST